MTMVMLAMLYMLEIRLTKIKSHPLLSCAYIVELLSQLLSRKDITEEEVLLRQMETRHRQGRQQLTSRMPNNGAGKGTK
jgi:hypothetical protein